MPLPPQPRRRTVEHSISSKTGHEVTSPGEVIGYTPDEIEQILAASPQARAFVAGEGIGAAFHPPAQPAPAAVTGAPAQLPTEPIDPSVVAVPTPRPDMLVDVNADNAPINTDDVMQEQTADDGFSTAEMIAAGAVGAAGGAGLASIASRLRSYQGLSGRNLRTAQQANQQVLQQAVSEGSITPQQMQRLLIEGPESPMLLEDMRGQTGGVNQEATGAAQETSQRSGRNARNSTQVVDGQAASEPANNTAPRPSSGSSGRRSAAPTSEAPVTALDPASAPIDTGDVVSDTQRQFDLSALPEGTRIVNENPQMQGGTYTSAGRATDSAVPQGAMINTQTYEMIVPTGDGRFIVIPPGSSHESVRRQVLGQAAQALRGVF